jgi:hypothetical protein
MANIMFDSGYMPLPINIKRGNPVPLDASSVHYPDNGGENKTAYENALIYARTNAVAYVGQIITVCEGVYTDDTFTPNMSHPKSGVYHIADKNGTLVKLVNNDVYTDDKKEDIEIIYTNVEIVRDEETGNFLHAIIMAPKSFKLGTSDLFINGIKYNNSEYEEVLKEGFQDICDRIKFTAFEVIPQVDGVGDEITICADYE